MHQLLIYRFDTVKKRGGTMHRSRHKQQNRSSYHSQPSCVLQNVCMLAVGRTQSPETNINGVLIQMNPWRYGWMTSVNCCADALTEILQLAEHTNRSNAFLARIRAVMLFCWKGRWEFTMTEGDNRNSSPCYEYCNNLVYLLHLKCGLFLYFSSLRYKWDNGIVALYHLVIP